VQIADVPLSLQEGDTVFVKITTKSGYVMTKGLNLAPKVTSTLSPPPTTPPANLPPNADFDYDPSSPYTNEIIQFTDLSTDSDGTIVSWDWDFGDSQTSSNQNPTHSYPENITYTVTLMVTDDDGATDTVQKDVTVLNRDPSVTVTYPNGGELVGGSINVTADASDPDGIITQVEFYYSDNGADWNLIGADNTSPYSVSWNTTLVSDGNTYLVRAVATDDDGGTASDDSDGAFTVDNTPPAVTIVNPPDLATLRGTTTIQIQASDLNGIASVLYNIDGGPWQNTVYNGVTGYYEASLDTTTLSEGNRTINAQATDNAANMNTDSITDTVDNEIIYTGTAVQGDYVYVGSFSLESFYTVSQIRVELTWSSPNNADLDLHIYDEPSQGGNHDGWDYINSVIDLQILTSNYHDARRVNQTPEWITVVDIPPAYIETFYIYVYGYNNQSNGASFIVTVTFQ
jgi:PKD repeat protein